MKYYSRLKLYKASNVTLDPETMRAYSYGWWRFVDQIDGVIVFNSYRYSSATSGHQAAVRRKLEELGVREYIDIEAPKGLQDIESALALYRSRIADLTFAMNKPKTRLAKNEERKLEIFSLKIKIAQVKMLIKGKADNLKTEKLDYRYRSASHLAYAQ